MMEKSVTKIVNCDTESELALSLAPIHFHVEQAFDLQIDPCLGSALPMVGFQAGGARRLSTNLIFDRDADENLEIAKVHSFLGALTKINDETQSIPLVLFKMGTFSFKGYLSKLGVTHGRFASNGLATQLKVEMHIIATEEGENAKK